MHAGKFIHSAAESHEVAEMYCAKRALMLGVNLLAGGKPNVRAAHISERPALEYLAFELI